MDVSWAPAGWPNWLLFVYDWDTITLSPNFTASVPVGVDLCSGFFPCSVYFKGEPRGAVEFSGNGYFSCLANLGCSTIMIEFISFACHNRLNEISVFKVQGSTLIVTQSSFSSCRSDTDGGAIQSYELAEVMLQSCNFNDVHSSGFGGVVSAFGSNLSISNSVFSNCSSQSGGGAVWSSAFQGCYGSTQPSSTLLNIEKSQFHSCRSDGSGGAVLANSGAASPSGETLNVTVSATTFADCKAGDAGGAFQTSGPLVETVLDQTTFISCFASGSGGAISALDSSSLSLVSSSIKKNRANGLGGGAIQVQDSFFLSFNTSFRDNTAPFGGGGVFFWQGSVRSARLGCPIGSQGLNVSCPMSDTIVDPSLCVMATCILCIPGTYQDQTDQTSCLPCTEGTFSDTVGSSFCIGCSPGTYSPSLAANSSWQCSACLQGTYSYTVGLSACLACPAGEFSAAEGSVTCETCNVGFYSGFQAAWCSRCISGVYTNSSYLSQRSITDFAQCPSQIANTAQVGRLVHGGNYGNGELMYWVIAPRNANNIVLSFNVFNTEEDHDFVSVYSCLNASCNSSGLRLLETFSGTTIPSAVSCSCDTMLIIWRSDESGTRSGWNATYFASYQPHLLDVNVNGKMVSQKESAAAQHLKSKDARMFQRTLMSLTPQVGPDGDYAEEKRNFEKLDIHVTRNDPLVFISEPRTQTDGLHVEFLKSRRKTLYYIQGRRDSTNHLTINSAIFDAFCDSSNSALFGKCIASGYNKLSVTIPDFPLYAGVQFNITVTKRDAYGNVILSDSASVLQAILALDRAGGSDQSASIVGSSLAQLSRGVAEFIFAIQPTFSNVDLEQNLVTLNQIYFYLAGSDSQAALSMTSDVMPLNLQQGLKVCPAGYILVLNQPSATEGPGVCEFCKPGTYSLNPLAHMIGSLSDAPGCINCPAAGICTAGGSQVQFKVGFWTAVDGVYVLTSCPSGYQLVNSTSGTSKGTFSNDLQDCKACQIGQYIINPNTDTCQPCPSGLTCSDGSCAQRIDDMSTLSCPNKVSIVGDWGVDSSGVYVLNGCPAAYYLNGDECQLCPALYYCSGGTLPSTPCASGQFSMPGSSRIENCSAAVFVVIVVNLHISRPYFTDQTSLQFQKAVSTSLDTDTAHVSVDIVQSGNDPSTTDVTSRIATVNAEIASGLVRRLNSQGIQASFNSNNLAGASLSLVQTTACVPGFELQSQPPPSVCQPCPANYYCIGGTAVHTPCPNNGFSPAGSNASTFCLQIAVVIVASFPVPLSNFTSKDQSILQSSLASSAGVSQDLVAIISLSSSSRRAGGTSTQVTSQIAVDDPTTAASVSSKLDQSTVNKDLQAQGLPPCSSLSVAVKSVIPVSSSVGSTLSTIVGSIVGVLFFVIVFAIGGYYLVNLIKKQNASKALFAAFQRAKPGEPATQNHLPLELQNQFVPETVLGKGAFGCVLQAKKKGSQESVAIKIILPEKGNFDDKQMRQLRREESVLRLFTSKKCEHAVLLAGLWAVEVRNDLCWFIMDLLDGHDLEKIVHSDSDDNKGNPVEDVECIKAARGVLAALKVMHSEGIVHRDIKPANIVCSKIYNPSGLWDGRSFAYKLIDFGSALGVDETLAKEAMMTLAANRGAAAGTPPYMSPEMFKEPERALYPTDIWSLGVTMFEIVTGRLPFQADSDLLWSFAIAGNMDEKAPNVLDVISESRRSTFDHNLAKVIATSLEKKVKKRYQSADEMHEAVYSCLIARGEGCYSAFISYRVASEAPLARILFDELNHSVTPGGHRVTVYWDAHRLVEGEDWEEGFASGLLNSLCFFPLLSYGSTAPLASLPEDKKRKALEDGWELKPVGRNRLEGTEADAEDNVLKELLIAGILLERRYLARESETKDGAGDSEVKSEEKLPGDSTDGKAANTILELTAQAEELGLLQLAYPILIGRQEPKGHRDYPRMGSFFSVQGGGGVYPNRPSPATARSVGRFLIEKGGLPEDVMEQAEALSVDEVVKMMTQLQGCQLWNHAKVCFFVSLLPYCLALSVQLLLMYMFPTSPPHPLQTASFVLLFLLSFAGTKAPGSYEGAKRNSWQRMCWPSSRFGWHPTHRRAGAVLTDEFFNYEKRFW